MFSNNRSHVKFTYLVTSSVLRDLKVKTYIYENSNFTQALNSFWANIPVAQ